MANHSDESAFGMRQSALRRQLEVVRHDLVILSGEAADGDDLAAHFIDRLRIAADNATGCALLAEARLSAPVAALTRTMLESVVTTHWASLSDLNAQAIQSILQNETLRLMKRFLSTGVGTIRHKRTGESKTRQILDSPLLSEIERPPRIDKMAKEGGLERLYVLLYGFMSVLAHGNATTIPMISQDGLISANLASVRSLLEALHVIVSNRVRIRRTTTVREIADILKLPEMVGSLRRP
jgi:Family of unknown function (DUF5677)